MAAKNTLNFRLSDTLRDRLREIGERERRSMSFLIEEAVAEYVAAHGRADSPEPEPKSTATRPASAA